MINTVKLSLGIILISLVFACNSIKQSPSSNSSSLSSNKTNNIEYIKTGTSFGMCLSYCQDIFTITPSKVNYVAKTNREPSVKHPEITRNDSITTSDYNDLVKSLDLNKFKSLPERIGCPDCDDGGAEWIEIKSENTVKKVEFEFNKTIQEIKEFLEKLRVFRNEHRNPLIINQSIASFINEPVKNPPVVINQYDYKGKTVYYIPPSCCDIPSQLYSQDGNVICSPDGGITGNGDGKCNDFFYERKNEKLIWKDTRK